MVAGMVVGIMGQVGTVLALVFGAVLVFGIGLGFPNGFVVGLLAVMGFGIVVGLGFGLMGWLQVPSPDDRGATPRSTVEGSRALVLAVQSTCAAGGLLMLGTWVGIGTGIHAGVGRGIVVGMAVGLVPQMAYGIVGGLVSRLLPGAWIPFSIVRSWLALRGHLPWRLLAFLDDCHRLGILRQVGPVHQFRHARLQQHLARTPVPPPEPS